MAALTIFWFRRDLRLDDNAGLSRALARHRDVQPIFIFDTGILKPLPGNDARVSFLHSEVLALKETLRERGSDLWVFHGEPVRVWKELLARHEVAAAFANRDNEPSAVARDARVAGLLASRGIPFETTKDQSLFERDEILTAAGTPYTVFTPYRNKVLATLTDAHLKPFATAKHAGNYHRGRPTRAPTLAELGFAPVVRAWPARTISRAVIGGYADTRDIPALARGTTRLGPHLRFGTISPRRAAKAGLEHGKAWLSELIWRDFFMQVLWHFPRVVDSSFRPRYDRVAWRSSKSELERWKNGMTGYPLVDAGMRELAATGFMHNRARMVAAQFLTKHLLHHWLEGERHFAEKLLDYDLASNNGNWQWCAGTGCDAAPYFRIFNPIAQARKFDRDGWYVRRWIPELGTPRYPAPMVDHDEARGRALSAFARALKGKTS